MVLKQKMLEGIEKQKFDISREGRSLLCWHVTKNNEMAAMQETSSS